MVKYWISNISKTIKAEFLELGTTNVHHKRKKMTPLVMLPWQQFCRWFCLIKNRNSQFLSETKNQLAQPIHAGTFDSLQRLQMGIFVFLTERDWSWKSCYGNNTKSVILFLLWWTFVVPSFKNTVSVFPEIFLFSILTFLSCKSYDVITDLLCIIQKCQYLRFFKKKNAILLYFERPFK